MDSTQWNTPLTNTFTQPGSEAGAEAEIYCYRFESDFLETLLQEHFPEHQLHEGLSYDFTSQYTSDAPSLTNGSTAPDEPQCLDPSLLSRPWNTPPPDLTGNYQDISLQYFGAGLESSEQGDPQSSSLPALAEFDLLARPNSLHPSTLHSKHQLQSQLNSPSPYASISVTRDATRSASTFNPQAINVEGAAHQPNESARIGKTKGVVLKREIQGRSHPQDRQWIRYAITGSLDSSQKRPDNQCLPLDVSSGHPSRPSRPSTNIQSSLAQRLPNQPKQSTLYYCNICSPRTMIGRNHDLKRHMEEIHPKGDKPGLLCSMDNPYVSYAEGCPRMKKVGQYKQGCGKVIKRHDFFVRDHLKLGLNFKLEPTDGASGTSVGGQASSQQQPAHGTRRLSPVVEATRDSGLYRLQASGSLSVHVRANLHPR